MAYLMILKLTQLFCSDAENEVLSRLADLDGEESAALELMNPLDLLLPAWTAVAFLSGAFLRPVQPIQQC